MYHTYNDDDYIIMFNNNMRQQSFLSDLIKIVMTFVHDRFLMAAEIATRTSAINITLVLLST